MTKVFIAIIFLFFLASGSARADSASDSTPGTTASVADAGSGCTNAATNDWATMTNTTASDDADATYGGAFFDASEISEEFQLSNFGFVITNGSTIDGIQVDIERAGTANDVLDKDISLTKTAGVQVGTNKAAAGDWPTTDATVTYGGATDKWGTTWTEAEIEATGFGLVVCVQTGAGDVNAVANIDFINITVYFTPPAPEAPTSLEQVAYRWFVNDDSTSVGRPGSLSTPLTASATGTPFRLRLLLHVDGSDLAASGTTTKLQFAERVGTCDTAFSGESYTDVTTATVISFHDNSTPADGVALTAHPKDPRHAATSSSHALIRQTYEEANNFTNSQGAIDAGADGLWDFALRARGAKSGKAYCLRAVQSGGGDFNFKGGGGYSVIPELTIDRLSKTRIRGAVRLRTTRLR